MTHWRTFGLSVLLASAALPAAAHGLYGEAGSLVGVSVDVTGRGTPLYPARDGTGRHYFEARAGEGYEVRLTNRSGQRLGVALIVDGLNAISGERGTPQAGGRMYVLDPWAEVVVRGWRQSLEDVRRFTFVDERSSYAARSGKASGKLGWIEVAVFRESRPWWHGTWNDPMLRRDAPSGRTDDRDAARKSAPAPSAPPATVPYRDEPRVQAEEQERLRGLGYVEGGSAGRPVEPPSHPGTGWGDRSYDPVRLVSFTPESRPAEIVTLRYEYAAGLRRLGILPTPWWPDRDRLGERERGEYGFAKPPNW